MNTTHVRRPAPRRPASLAALAAVVLLVGCGASPLRQPVEGYTCCNLRSNGGWISSDNVLGGELLPAGEPVKFESRRKSDRVYGTIGERGIGFHHDWGRSADETLQQARRIVVAKDPREQLLRWPAEVRAAVDAGRVMLGMSRAQVTMALGYPSQNDTPDLAVSTWRYRTLARDGAVDLRFAPDGTLFELAGQPAAVAVVQMERSPRRAADTHLSQKEDSAPTLVATRERQKEERVARQQ